MGHCPKFSRFPILTPPRKNSVTLFEGKIFSLCPKIIIPVTILYNLKKILVTMSELGLTPPLHPPDNPGLNFRLKGALKKSPEKWKKSNGGRISTEKQKVHNSKCGHFKMRVGGLRFFSNLNVDFKYFS